MEGFGVIFFGEISYARVNCFSNFQEHLRENIVEILNIVSLFLKMMEDKGNKDLKDDVTKEELNFFLISPFKKEKDPSPAGWTIKFYLCFFEMIEDSNKKN